VLPFSCAPDDAYLADGIVEDLVDTLSTTSSLRVRPAGVARTRDAPDPRELGRSLAVDHVVLGSVRRTPTGLRVSARLLGVADGFQIWAHRNEGAEADALSMSDQLSAGIAQALSTQASRGTRTMDPRAVDLYLRARAALRRFWGEHAQAAADLLEQAVEIAPTSTPVICALAIARVQAWIRRDARGTFEPARAAVDRALATGHGEAFLAESLLQLNLADSEAAATNLGIALARAPMSAQVHETCGRILVELGAQDAARHHFETARELDPGRASLIDLDLARLDALEGNWERGFARIEAVTGDPDPAISMLGVLFVARLAAWRGDAAQVDAAVTRLSVRITGLAGPSRTSSANQELARVFATWRATGTVDATAWDRLCSLDPAEPRRNPLVVLQRVAETAMLIGDPAAALRALRAAADGGLIDIVYLDRCPLFRELADHPAWRACHQIVADRARRALAAFRAAGG
jgi:serine/threonine-protein kinase